MPLNNLWNMRCWRPAVNPGASRQGDERRRSWLHGRCLLCESSLPGRGGLCTGCHADLPWLAGHCHGCALPLPSGGLCGACQRQSLVTGGRVWAALIYRPPVDSLLQGLKFRQRLLNAACLGRLMGERLQRQTGPLPQLVVPVPLHRQRIRERGFNQALELARPLATMLGLPLDSHCCRRRRATASQSGLSSAERWRNVRQAFYLRHRPAVDHLVLVDDVMTTGATSRALAQVFLQAGVARVDIWVCARVLPPSC